MKVFSSVGTISTLSFAGALVASSLAWATKHSEPPSHSLVSAADGHVFSVGDAKGRFLALHFLGRLDTPECEAFVREYLAKAPTVAGVEHVFAAGADAGAVKKWAAQFSRDGASIHVDEGRALATELKIPGEDTSATLVFGPDGEELFRYVPAYHADHLPFGEFAAKIAEHSRRAAIAEYNIDQKEPLAVEGYDVVAYFTKSAAVKGSADLASVYRGVTYRFSTPGTRLLFAADPEKYLPTYGGWCASAMGAKGAKVEIDPANFKVKDGRLFLFYKSLFGDALKDWNRHEKEWEPAADANWKKLSGEGDVKPAK